MDRTTTHVPHVTHRGRVAVVTGAAGEIGRAYCAALADAGAIVVATDVDGAGLQAAIAELNGSSRQVAVFEADVSAESSTRQLGEFVRSEWGRCDILVNNAGIYRGMRLDSQMEVDIDYWRLVMSVNVDGALLCTQALAPLMIERRWGRVVNQSSIAAYQGAGGHYGVSKLALIALTQGFARELGRWGITVNAIAPGLIFDRATLELLSVERLERRLAEMPISRRATPAELVGMLLFLVGDSADWITGQTHVVDGGLINRL